MSFLDILIVVIIIFLWVSIWYVASDWKRSKDDIIKAWRWITGKK